jgi:hypothetical protein
VLRLRIARSPDERPTAAKRTSSRRASEPLLACIGVSERKWRCRLTHAATSLLAPARNGARALLLVDPGSDWAGQRSQPDRSGSTPHSRQLVPAQLVSPLTRSDSASASKQASFNRWLWVSVALSKALQGVVVLLPFLSPGFGTAALSVDQCCVCVTMTNGVLWFGKERNAVAHNLAQRELAPSAQ